MFMFLCCFCFVLLHLSVTVTVGALFFALFPICFVLHGVEVKVSAKDDNRWRFGHIAVNEKPVVVMVMA